MRWTFPINQKEKEIVKYIYNLYLNGNGVSKIQNELNAKKIPTKNEGKYSATMVSYILKNPLYIGYVKWDKVINKGEHQQIIKQHDFKAVQKRIIKNGGVVDDSIRDVIFKSG